MEGLTSPQQIAEGEGNQLISEKNQVCNQSYASKINGQKVVPTLDLCPVTMEKGIPTVEFSVDEVNAFTREEGLHQAVIFKFSYGKPELQELRRLLPKHFDVKGMCNTGQLEYRHILVRFDLFEDFANVVSKTSGYIKSKGDDFFFRTFPWTMDFNPREETSKAVTWISFPKLPANFFAKRSIMSIASVVGKPIAIDKATQDRTRPSTARVKILINLLDKHPKIVKLKIVDKKYGKIVEYDQRIVFDNLPKFCTCCNHQGHDVYSCRRNLDEEADQVSQRIESEKQNRLGNLDENLPKKFQGDARELLNRKRKAQEKDVHKQGNQSKAVWKQKSISILQQSMAEATDIGSESVEAMEIGSDVNCQKHIRQAQTNEKSDVFDQEKEHTQGNKVNANADQTLSDEERKIESASVGYGHKILNADSNPSVADESTLINPNEVTAANDQNLNVLTDGEGYPTATIDNAAHVSDVQQTTATSSLQSPIDLSSDEGQNSDTNTHSISTTDIAQQTFVEPTAASQHNEGAIDVRGHKSNEAGPVEIIQQNAEDQSVLKDFSSDQKLSNVVSIPPASNLFGSNDNSVMDFASQSPLAEESKLDNESITATIHNEDQSSFMTTESGHKLDTFGSVAAVHAMPNAELIHEQSFPRSFLKDSCEQGSISQKKMIPSAPLISSAFDIAISEQLPNESATDFPDLQHGSNSADPNNVDSSDERINENAEEINGLADETETATIFNEDKEQACKSANTRATIVKYPSEVLTLAAIKTNVITSSSNSFVALANFDKQEDKMMGGVIKKIQSYTPMSISSAYSGDDLNDIDEISSLEGNNKQIIVANMRDMVIKSKLWDQHFSDDDESLDEHQDECNNQKEECDDSNKATVIKNTAEKIGIGYQSYSAVKSSQIQQIATQSPTLGKQLMQEKEMPNPILQGRHVYNEGQEEDFLNQCRVEASIKGDLSPMHSARKKKSHQREKSWDGKVGEDVIIRKLPMRIAKLQHSVLNPTKHRNKRDG